MTSPYPVPPLPPPRQPAQAAQALQEAARAAAGAWAQPLTPDRHSLAMSQLHSTLRDLGIAARGLAAWQPADAPPGPASREFTRHVTAAASWLLSTWTSLDGLLAPKGTSPLPDPDEPGAALCHAARCTITAWRQASGSSADRDTAIRRLITAIGFLSAATLALATYAPCHSAIGLQAAGAGLAEVTGDLTAAIREADAVPGHDAGPARQQPGGPE